MKKILLALLVLPLMFPSQAGAADAQVSVAEETGIDRESFDNPLIQIETNMGNIILELFPREAPETVANFIGLAEGRKPFTDPGSGAMITRPYYDGLIFHRVIDNFMIQGGSLSGDGIGGPGYSIRDEINARSLGLDKMTVLQEDGKPHPVLGINGSDDFQSKVMAPLYARMGIDSQAELEQRIDEVFERVNNMTVKESLENLGYRYTETVISRAPVRGVIAMANSGPDSNGAQFFINLADTPWLTGRHTVFGKVRAGMDVVDAIGATQLDVRNRPLREVRIISVRQLGDPADSG